MPDSRSIAARALPWLTWALTFHILAIALLFGLVRLPAAVVRGIAAWKEVAGVVLLVIVAIRAAAGRGPRVAITGADLLVASWALLCVALFATQSTVFRNFVPLKAAAFGLRDGAFFLVFYFIGRSTPEVGLDDRMAKRAFTVLCVTCSIAVLEQLFVTPQMLVVIGVGSYVRDFLGTEVYTQGNVFGLPDNYWSLMGGHLVRRSGSVFLSSQGFALIFVVLLPAATARVLHYAGRFRLALQFGYCIIWAGLIATFTRAAIAVSVLQLLVMVAMRRKVTSVALAAGIGLFVFLISLAVMPGLATFALETVTGQTGSNLSHVKDWTNGITAFLEQPWGYGLGTTDQSAVRGGLVPLTSDNLYLKYAVEMGLTGVLLVIGSLGAFLLAGARLARYGQDENQRTLGVVVALGAMGIFIQGMTGAVFSDPLVAYLMFWFAGSAVTLAQRVNVPHSVVIAYA